jgi:RNA polymerase sigma-70 factor (ECF subfamily)
VSEAAAPGAESLDWRAVYERYAVEILHYLMKLIAEPEAAKDLMQETFARAIERQGQLRDRASVRSWLYRIATNLAVSSLRRRQVRARLMFARAEHPDPALIAAEVDHVRSALRSIAPAQAACLVLRERGFSRREIAAICGLSEEGTKSRLARGEANFVAAYQRLERGASR